MYFSVILKHRDGKAGDKNISQQYSITIHTSHDPVILLQGMTTELSGY